MIPEGQVATYGQIAKQAGLPRRAARMVGRALGAAPAEMALPWHRIVNAQGKIAIPKGSRGFDRQKELLEAEGITVNGDKLELDQHRWDPTPDELVWGPGSLFDPNSVRDEGASE